MFLNDIRSEELPAMKRVGQATSADYLTMDNPPPASFMMTNPPFTKSVDFVDKAKQHITGPICILQSIAWQGTQKRSEWLKQAGLAYVLNLPNRPKWEVDSGSAPSNIWDFAWFIFLPDHSGPTVMDWLSDPQPFEYEEQEVKQYQRRTNRKQFISGR